MKKIKQLAIISAFTLQSIAFASQAQAKTQGSYLGVDLLHTTSKHEYTKLVNYPEFDNSKVGFGLGFKYAFNFNNFFVAPGAFYDHIATEAKDKDGDSVSINNRFGAKVDFGYDITDNFALYVSGGVASVDYEVNWSSEYSKSTGKEAGLLFGVGAQFQIAENFSVKAEYSMQQVDLKAPSLNNNIEVKTGINTARVGVAYNF